MKDRRGRPNGRPRHQPDGPPLVIASAAIPEREYELIRKIARDDGVTVSAVIRRLLTERLAYWS